MADKTHLDSELKKTFKSKPVSEASLLDDYFMVSVLRNNKEGVQEMLRIVLDKPDLIVEEISVQEVMPSLTGRSLAMDVVAKDSKGARFNIEVQNDNRGAIPERARYHMALLDADSLEPKQDFKELPENYVIFLTKRDVLGGNQPIYHVERIITETGALFAERSHIIYVNCSWKLGAQESEMQTPLEQLISDMRCTKPAKMYIDSLAQRAQILKDDPEGASIMMDDYYQEGVRDGWAKGEAIGEARGREEKAAEIIEKLQKLGVDDSIISQLDTVD